jgi:hypothetical protein
MVQTVKAARPLKYYFRALGNPQDAEGFALGREVENL